jgi:hypothetical protein
MKKPKTRGRPYLIIGWREWLSLPELGVDAIKVKVDTGARTSSLHASEVRIVRRGSVRYAVFKVHPIQRDVHHEVSARAKLIGHRSVRNSGGAEERRPVVETAIEIGGQRWPIELTLTRRDMMGFRMLLGRQAIRGRALVDSGASYLNGAPPKD